MKKGVKRALIAVGCVILALVILIGGFYLVVSHDWSKEPPVSVAEDDHPYIAQNGQTMVSAHRSGGGIAPENTMMAFKNCVENGSFAIDIFEFDLHITKDGELILLHDETLDRTSDSVEVFGREDVMPSEMTYEELRQLNMGENFTTDSGETPYKGLRGDDVPEDLRIVRLQDVFEYLADYGQYSYIIEIKDSEDLGRQACDKLYEIMREYNMIERVVVGTFHGEITEYIDEKYPDMLRSASIAEVAEFYFDALADEEKPDDAYSFEALQIPDRLYFNLATTQLVNYAHEHNIAVQYWTINDPQTVKELAAIGADAIMSDDPNMAYNVLYGDGSAFEEGETVSETDTASAEDDIAASAAAE